MLDKTDKKILHVIDANSRATTTAIAKKLGMSKQLLKYHIDRLVKTRIIEKFYTVVNSVKLGLMYFRVYVRLQGISSEEENRLIESFVSNPYVTWVIGCRGQWDIIASVYARDTEHFSGNFQFIVDQFQRYILKKKIVLIRNVIFSTRDYFSESDSTNISVYGGVTEHIPIDELEHRILQELSADSRISILDLARKTCSTPDTMRSKIKKLEKHGVIKAHKLAINYSKTGVLFFLISITLTNASKASRNKLENYCKSHPNVVYYVNLLGDHDIDLEVEVIGQEEIDNLLKDLRNGFPNIIRDMETTQIVKQDKIHYYPFRENPTSYLILDYKKNYSTIKKKDVIE